jgi:hypothetical protein
LLLDRAKLAELNYLDEENYFLDNSDHDLMARAYLEKQYICGYVPIEFRSPLSFGSTRASKTGTCKEFFINQRTKEELQKKCKKTIGVYREKWVSRGPSVYSMY